MQVTFCSAFSEEDRYLSLSYINGCNLTKIFFYIDLSVSISIFPAFSDFSSIHWVYVLANGIQSQSFLNYYW